MKHVAGQNKPEARHWVHLRRLQSTEAAALIEFAVALPLLVVLVVGIFDFGGAFNLKQELNNAAREGARFGASQPTNDLSNSGTPRPWTQCAMSLPHTFRPRESMTAAWEPCHRRPPKVRQWLGRTPLQVVR